jgi:hypothetical protein
LPLEKTMSSDRMRIRQRLPNDSIAGMAASQTSG